jgi:hypothetical protein
MRDVTPVVFSPSAVDMPTFHRHPHEDPIDSSEQKTSVVPRGKTCTIWMTGRTADHAKHSDGQCVSHFDLQSV